MAGYNGYSKSWNAIAAEDSGLVTRSGITKAWLAENAIDESPLFIKWLVRVEYILADEWHHTSKTYNRTKYFSVDGIRETLDRYASTGDLDRLHQLYASADRPTTRIDVWAALMEMRKTA